MSVKFVVVSVVVDDFRALRPIDDDIVVVDFLFLFRCRRHTLLEHQLISLPAHARAPHSLAA